MERLTRPLFSFDPGWLFVAAGLAVCAAGMVLPAQGDLYSLQMQLDQLAAEETRAYARLKAHSDFMDQIDRADPALIRRLAATQLNVVPEGDTPVLLAASANLPVTHWIESAVQVDLRPPKMASTSILSRLANGPHRLWMIGGGIMSVFIGVLLGPISWRGSRNRLAENGAMVDVAVRIEAEPLLEHSPASHMQKMIEAPPACDEACLPTADGVDSIGSYQSEAAVIDADSYSEILTEEKVESVLDGIESDLHELKTELENAATFDDEAFEPDEDDSDAEDQDQEFGDVPEPGFPEIATDAGHLFDSTNRMSQSENPERE